jgi:hypothetical protein
MNCFAVVLPLSLTTMSLLAQPSQTEDLAYANISFNDPSIDAGINIYPTVTTENLFIEVSDKFVGVKVTVSIFNTVGEIVLESVLGLGLNRVEVAQLPKGSYVAVVRENDVYASKSNFEVK